MLTATGREKSSVTSDFLPVIAVCLPGESAMAMVYGAAAETATANAMRNQTRHRKNALRLCLSR